MPKRIGSLVAKIVSIVVFIVVATLTVFFAYGYQFDFQLGDVKKTSIIDIAADVDEATVLFNGEQVADRLPFQIKNIVPGEYDIAIEKEGYFLWERSIKVKEDLVSIVRDVLLVPNDIGDLENELHIFSDEEEVILDENYIISYLKGAKEMVLTSMLSNGKIEQDVIEFYRDGIDSILLLNNEKFLVKYPNSQYSENAQYWMAEALFVTRRYNEAITEYMKLISNYPQSQRVPNSLLKIGYSYYDTGQVTEAEKILKDLIQKYPGTTAARDAKDRLERSPAT